MLGHVQFVVGMADFQVAVGHLGHHAHLGQVACGGHRLFVGVGGFGTALELAEQVELVAGGELAVGQVDHRQFVLLQEGLGRQLRAADAGFGLVLEATGIHRLFVHGCGAAQVRIGGLQFDVVTQRLGDQAVQHRVVVQRPPAVGQRLVGGHLRVLGVNEGRIGLRALERRVFRQGVVGADGPARGQAGQRDDQAETGQGGVHRPACVGAMPALPACFVLLVWTVTVAVRPAISSTPLGTSSMLMRTGIRCASRTQSKAGVTFGSRLLPLLR
ncbi:hypothetical protein G6F65_017096 [Rhizopus arrhizus]|nr:hypothetical protein G6F65_017096 [Rhizopus arrhizus]